MKSIIIGAGKYGAVYLAYLKESGIDIVGFIDDNENLIGKKVETVEVIGSRKNLNSLKKKYNIEAVYCPIGNNKLRVEILKYCNSIGLKTPNFIHSSVLLSPKVKIGDKGVYILPRTIIMPFVSISDFVMISVGANVIHHTKLGEGTFLSNGVNLGASIETKKCVYIGMGSTVMTGVKVLGENCLIGAGAVVINDIPDNEVWIGNPARFLKKMKIEK